MVKYWKTNRLFLDVVFSAILSLVLGFAFINLSIQKTTNAYNAYSLYETSEIDFDISSPSKTQLTEISKYDYVDKVFGYFYSKTNVTYSTNKQRQTNVLFADDMSQLDITMYNKQRLLKESNNKNANQIYVDYNFIKETDLDLGGKVIIPTSQGNVEFEITRVYESNIYYVGGAVLVDATNLSLSFITQSKSYSGAFIKVNNYTTAKGYFLNTYKPLGKLKDRSEFNTQEEYDIHYNAFMNASYGNEQTDFVAKASAEKLEYDARISSANIIKYSGVALTLVLVIAFNIALFYRDTEKKYFTQLNKKESIINYYRMSYITEVFSTLILTSIITLILIVTSKKFISTSFIVNTSIMYAIAIITAFTAAFILNTIMVKKLPKGNNAN